VWGGRLRGATGRTAAGADGKVEEGILSNVLRLAPWMMAIWAAVPVTPAGAQGNIDAGKTPAQIFGDTCAACHRSARELRRPSASFLRTHYTTGSEEASAMANYLAGVPSGAAQPKQPPRQQPAETPAANAAKQPPRQAPDQQPKAAAQREQPKGRPSAATAQVRQAPVAEERPPDPPPAPPAPVLEPFEE
jgi:mono/diheme cytochrome c family protein